MYFPASSSSSGDLLTRLTNNKEALSDKLVVGLLLLLPLLSSRIHKREAGPAVAAIVDLLKQQTL